MERCVVAPAVQGADLLKLASALAVAALKRGGERRGDVIVFLPGMQEMLRLQVLLKKALPKLRVWLIHSDVIDNEDEDEIALPDADGQRVVALATVIGARSITLDGMRYAILHPAVRDEVLHASGISRLVDEPLSRELEGNMCGRVARVSPGLATLLYETDDST
jgi:HrpA-like RNA helicase